MFHASCDPQKYNCRSVHCMTTSLSDAFQSTLSNANAHATASSTALNTNQPIEHITRTTMDHHRHTQITMISEYSPKVPSRKLRDQRQVRATVASTAALMVTASTVLADGDSQPIK